MKPSDDDQSRHKAIEFLKKFRDGRRRGERGSGKSDLQVLRGKTSWARDVVAAATLVLLTRLAGWYDWSGWVVVALVLCAVGYYYLSKAYDRRIEGALSLFDEGVPQQAGGLLARIEVDSEPMPESRRKAIASLEKFSGHRRKYDAYSPLSDLQALRARCQTSGPGLMLFVFMAMGSWHEWKTVMLVSMVVLFVIWHCSQWKLRRALALFDECIPRSADEVLARVELEEAEASSRLEWLLLEPG